MKLEKIFILSFFIIGLMGTISLVSYSSHTHNNHLKNMVYENLEFSVELARQDITNFLEEQKQRILLVADVDFNKKALNTLEDNLSDDLRGELNHELEEISELNPDFHDIFILNKQGIVVASTDTSLIEENKSNRDYFIYGQKELYLDTKDYGDALEHSIMVISVPIKDEKENCIGLLVVIISIEELVESFSIDLGLGETEEIYLVNEEGFLITPSKFLSGENKGVLTQKVDAENARNCLEDLEEFYLGETKEIEEHKEEIAVFKDYMGEEVFGSHSYVLETKWCVLVEVEKQEVLEDPLKKFIIKQIIVSLIIIFLLTLVGFFIGRYFDKRNKFKHLPLSKHSGIGKKKPISLLMIVGILVAIILVIFTVVISVSSLAKYDRAVELVFYVDLLDSRINQELTGTWRFLAGDETVMDEHESIHGDLSQIKSELSEKKGKRVERLLGFIESEENLNLESFFYGEGGFFDSIIESRESFIEKNNKHVNRLLGYLKNWVEPKTEKEEEVFEILDGIRKERIFFEDFNPRSSNAQEVIENFRETNDEVVEGLVKLWQEEIDSGIKHVSSTELKNKLQRLKIVVSQINSTSFPMISKEDALLLGIEHNESVRFGSDADSSTQELYGSCKEYVEKYEAEGGEPLWMRVDVDEIGKNVTPVFTLGKIVSCQQGLRVSAEKLFELQLDFANNIEPELILIRGNLNRLKEEILTNVENISLRIQILITFMSLFIVFFIILFVLYFVFNKKERRGRKR